MNTPVFDKLLAEYLTKPDTTFVSGTVQHIHREPIGGDGVRTVIVESIGVIWKEELWLNYTHTNETQSTSYVTEQSSGEVSEPGRVLPLSHITGKKKERQRRRRNQKYRETSMSSPQPRSGTLWTGRLSSRNLGWDGPVVLSVVSSPSIAGTTLESIQTSTALSSYLTNKDLWDQALGLSRSSRLRDEITGSSSPLPQEIRGLITSPYSLLTVSIQIEPSSRGSMLSITLIVSSQKLIDMWGSVAS